MALLASRYNPLHHLLHAAGAFAAARLRSLGRLPVATDWEARAAICERCPLRFIQCGISYCGKPFIQQMEREESTEGCGCPCRDKAKSPKEHCPIDAQHRGARRSVGECTCKWCAGGM